MNKYLFLFTISPVQSFIKQARKTRDLYNGSRILSDLIEYAIKQIEPAEPIFPKKGLTSYPNRFIAIIEKENDDILRNFGNELKKKVLSKFEEYSIFAVQETKVDLEKLPDDFYKQIRNHLIVQWVALPYSDESYKEQYKEIESLLGAIKNIREFDQFEETGRKCSLCGERNMIFYKKGSKSKFQLKPKWDLLTQQEKNAVNHFNDSLLGVFQPFDSSEGLCAVCFTKRFYLMDEFPSTAEIATKHLPENSNIMEALENYKKNLNEYFDYQLLFEENRNEYYFERQNISKELLEKSRESYKAFIKKIKNNKLKLTPYYAMVMFDGDSMGNWLSGSHLKENVSLLEFHKSLTKALGEFASATQNIETENKGKVVYAGGEDFLAFVNLNHLYAVLNDLRKKFNAIVNNGIKEFILEDKVITFSAGIVIAHYKFPLSEVLNWCRKLEKEAKDKDNDKNAFAIAVMKHSGEINSAILKWGEKESENLDVLKNLTNDLANGIYSKTFINNLSEEFFGLDSLRIEVLQAELRRLLARSSNILRKEKESKEEYLKRKKEKIEKTTVQLKSIYKEDLKFENFLSALFIAEFISRHLNGGKNEN